MVYTNQPSNQPTYYAIAPALDFGSIALGDSQTKSVRIEYKLAPGASAGAVLSTQASVTGEVFLIDDQGNNAEDLVTLSADNSTFFSRLNLASFPATEPPNFLTIYVRVAPVTATTNKQGDYVVYLRSVGNAPFSVPIHFRIVGGRYVNVNDVRRILGPLGKQKVTLQNTHDSFPSSSFPGWTNDLGTWALYRDSTRSALNSLTGDALSHISFPDFGDYNTSVTVKLTSTGDAGIAFGFTNATNYWRCTISTRDSLARAEQIVSGAVTTLTTLSVGDIQGSLAVNRQYNLRVEKHPTSFDFFMDEALVFRYQASTTSISGPSGLVLSSSGGNVAVADFNEFNVTQDTFQFSDADITDYVLEAEKFVERRTQRVFTAQTLTELHDYDTQDVVRMPYLISRSFNTLPTQFAAPVSMTIEHAIYVNKRPVLGIIAVEEDIASDTSTANWQLKKQGRDGDYIVYPELGKILFINNLPRNGHQNLKVIYSIGAPEVPPEVKQYVSYKAALAILSNIGGGMDGIDQMVQKITVRIRELEEYVPQKTLVYSVGSKQFLR